MFFLNIPPFALMDDTLLPRFDGSVKMKNEEIKLNRSFKFEINKERF